MKNNKLNLILHFTVIVFTLYIAYMKFIRFLLADNESIAIAMLNPSQLPTAQPILFSSLMLLLILIFFALLKIKPSSGFVFRGMKGMFGLSVVFLILQFLILLAAKQIPSYLSKSVYQSQHLFVEIQASSTRLREKPSLSSKVITNLNKGTLLLLNDVKKNEGLTWNRILLEPQKYAWIVRVAPSIKGEAKRLSRTYKFHILVADQYSLILASFAFVWGFLSFRKG